MSSTSKRNQDRLVPIVAAGATAAALSWLPWIGFLTYPFRLLATTVHELSHGLAALSTGGAFVRYVVFPNGAGLAYTGGGWRYVVIPAGYLGVTVFAACLLLLGHKVKHGRRALITVGVAMAALSLRYAVPTLFTEQALAGVLTLLAGLGLGAALVWVGLKASAAGTLFAIHLVAFQATLSAFTDLWTLIGISSQSERASTDAHAMAEIGWLPPIFWAVLWAAAALLLTLWALSWSARRAS